MAVFTWHQIVNEAVVKCGCHDIPKHAELHRQQGDVIVSAPDTSRRVHLVEDGKDGA